MSDDERMSEVCPDCGKRVRIVVPAGGDGSAYVYYRHTKPGGERCPGSRGFVGPTT
jgi:hypothetical protein